jgi:uncharacterized protein (DUF924 family)
METMDRLSPQHIIHFWFKQISPKQWWVKDPLLDAQIADKFGPLLQQAVAGKLSPWRNSSEGRLAEIIVLDQFSRNIHRDTPMAFAADEPALLLAQEAVEKGCHIELPPIQVPFLLMPYMHSESAQVHQQAVILFKQFAQDNLDFEYKHQAIIEQFGRYPHRNAILGRQSTTEEIAFLQQAGSSF